MSRILFIAICVSMIGCAEPNVEQTATKHAIAGHAALDEVTIEGCQYLLGNWGNATVLTHKGNCNNPIHIHNGGNHD
jgi:hypothetical protein